MPVVKHFAGLVADWAAMFQLVAFLVVRLASAAEQAGGY